MCLKKQKIRNLTEPTLDNIKLTAADCFMLALEKQHIRKTGLSNNTCRYLLELSGYVGKEDLNKKINDHPDLRWLASIAPEKRYPMSIPAWRKQAKTYEIPLGEYTTDELIPEEMINERITSHEPPFLRFDLLHRSDGNTALVFSWHHLLMDGYGATLLLRQLATKGEWPRLQLIDETGEHVLPWAQLKN